MPKPTPKHQLLRITIEVGFIVFLFYSNLLMSEFTRSNSQGKTLFSALRNIFTQTNLGIALVAAIAAHFIFEFLRKRL